MMDSKEDKLSSYIDSLNNEREPKEHGSELETAEMQELFETIRKVHSLKEPALPDSAYPKTLAANINKRLKPRRRWYYAAATAAAAVALIVTLNTAAPFNRTNIVYAMEQAYKGVKSYHGVLNVVETNAEGKAVTQSKVEVWADKEGRYYAKGLEGTQKDLITANNGQKKWQIQPKEKEVDIFSAFPDPYGFTFEIGKEIEDVKSAVKTKVIGDENVSGRTATLVEVTPKGGSAYKIWIDKESKMPIQKQSAMEYSLEYKVYYENINFAEAVPKDLLMYNVPKGFKEVNTNTDQVVNTLDEAAGIAGFAPKAIMKIPASYSESSISVISSTKTVKTNFNSQDNIKKVSILQMKAKEEFKPSSMAVLGRINNSVAEIQSPLQAQTGVLQGGGVYAGITGLSSVRWQQEGIEYAVIGNTSIDELEEFIKALVDKKVELTPTNEQPAAMPEVEVPVDLKAEEGDQKNADAGNSPWKLDPVYVSQVFVSLKISPEGIKGDYPIKYEELKVVKNTGLDSVVEVGGSKATIRRVYLKKLIRQDSTGIWTVVGYDTVNK